DHQVLNAADVAIGGSDGRALQIAGCSQHDSPPFRLVSQRSQPGEEEIDESAGGLVHLEEEDGEARGHDERERYDAKVARVVHEPSSSCGKWYAQSSHSQWPSSRCQ